MQLGRVIGTATTTVRHASFAGAKLLVVRLLMADGQSGDGEPVLAIDQLGAGTGDKVLVTNDGKYTAEILKNKNTPVRWSVMGIPDR